MERIHIRISGRVQGVGFRYSCLREAHSLTLTGWVRNCPDGTVEVTAEGPAADLTTFTSWCRHGPSFAQVTAIQSNTLPATGEFSDFRIVG